jgi:TolA-binding protein
VHLRRFTYALVVLELVVLAGCASAPKNDQRVHAMELKLKKRKAQLQDLKERNMVLEKRSHLSVTSAPAVTVEDDRGESIGGPLVTSEPPVALPKSFARTSVATSVAMPKILPSKLPARISVVPAPLLSTQSPPTVAVSFEKTGEHYLYSKILDTYRTKNIDDMRRTVELLLKSYPDSIFADNAIYLSGLQTFERGDYKSALTTFDKLLRDYPSSNKAVAALFAKGSIQRRTGRPSDARRAFLQLRDLYPGSPEAARATVELKLLESASVKHRET